MNRKDFLKQLGFSASAIMATYCLGGLTSCSEDGVKPQGEVDFTLDVNDSANQALNNVGGCVKVNSVVIAQPEQDLFVAVTQVCSHEGLRQVRYRQSSNDFFCSAHGAIFGISGQGENSAGKHGLTIYNVEVNENLMHVFS